MAEALRRFRERNPGYHAHTMAEYRKQAKQQSNIRTKDRERYRKPHFVTRILKSALTVPVVSYDAKRGSWIVIGRQQVVSSQR